MDLEGVHGYHELLRRGCFITMSTVVARTDAVRSVGGANPAYRYVLDYDLWLRIARQHPLRYVPEILASWRVHDRQFTQSHPDIALAEESHLLRPIMLDPSYPRAVRVAVGDYLFGRHRDCARALLRRRRPLAAIGAAAGIARYPDRVIDYCRDKVSRLPGGRLLDGGIGTYLQARDAMARARAHGRNALLRNLLRARRAPQKIRRILDAAVR
jgi:hypothetical protein